MPRRLKIPSSLKEIDNIGIRSNSNSNSNMTTTFYDMPNDIQELIYNKKHKEEYKDIMNELINVWDVPNKYTNDKYGVIYLCYLNRLHEINPEENVIRVVLDYAKDLHDKIKEDKKPRPCKCCKKIIKKEDEIVYCNGCVAGYCNFYCCKYCKDEVLSHNDEEDCFETTDKYRIIQNEQRNKKRDEYKSSMMNGGFTKWLNEGKRTKKDIKELLKDCGIKVSNFDRTKKGKIIELLTKHFE